MCAEGSPVVLDTEAVFTHFRAILKVPALAGIVILASGRPAPVLLRTRRRIPPVLPYTPRLMRLFSFPRVFDFSIFSFSRPFSRRSPACDPQFFFVTFPRALPSPPPKGFNASSLFPLSSARRLFSYHVFPMSSFPFPP